MILVCHRCGNEFSQADEDGFEDFIADTGPDEIVESAFEAAAAEDAFDEELQKAATEHHDAIPEFIRDEPIPSADNEPTGRTPFPDIKPIRPRTEMPFHTNIEDLDNFQSPTRRPTRLWPWLFLLLFIGVIAGFWTNKDAWLNDAWLRSVLINLDIPVQPQDSDWRVAPKSVTAQWIKRDDGKHVMIIEGRVENLLQSEIAPPNLRLQLFAADDTNRKLREHILPITQPPLLDAIRHAPFMAPQEDTVPVPALGSRGFILVLEEMPGEVGDFTLQPVAR